MKNLKHLLFLFLLILSFVGSYAQDGFSKFFRYEEDTLRRGNFIDNFAYDSAANEVFFCLNTASFSGPSVINWCVLTKIDVQGNVIQKRLDTFSNANNEYDAVLKSRNNQFLYWGGSMSDYNFTDSSTMDFLITKTDKNLNRIWRKRYVNPGIQIGYVRSITEDKVGNLTILGTKATYTGGVYPAVPDRFYLMKIDSMGTILWEKTIGDTYYNGQVYYNNGVALLQDDENGAYLAVGRTFSYGETNGTAFAIKADSNGNELWHQAYMQNYYMSIMYGTTRTKENTESYINVGQVLGANANATLAFANKIDGNGNEIWNKTFNRTPLNHTFRTSTTASDNSDIIICGSTQIDTYPASVPNSADKGWLVRLDQNGNEIWNRMITPDSNFNSVDYLYRIVGLKDGSILALGSSNSIDSRGNNTQAGWVVKVNSKGCLFADCRDLGIIENDGKNGGITIYPNPTNGIVIVQNKEPFPKNTTITLIDLLGRKLRTLPSPSGKMKINYDLSDLAASMYMLQINYDGNSIQKKITLQF